ncbi:MAG: hypothetical protein JW953_24025 [Anaerolineae bacterium]|nr:hypothetical protein [Anaerolineae bacterium]
MRNIIFTKRWFIVLGLLLLIALPFGVVYAQGDGTIMVNACTDQNADGDCDDAVDGVVPAGVEACLNDETNCLPIPATFTDLAPGSYTPFLRFSGTSQGYYPTTPRTPIDLAEGEQAEVTLGAVYPVHPKGVAIHAGLNKVYVAFQGPVILSEVSTSAVTETVVTKPYPFVAVIDGDTDEVLRTIPGGPDGIGRGPWGVAVSGDNVYVGAFEDGLVSVIDANTDNVIANVKPERDTFGPTAPDVNPLTGWVHFPDYKDGRVVIINGTEIVAEPPIANQYGFSPFELVVAKSLQGYNYVTMRDAITGDYNNPGPFQFRGLNSAEPFGYTEQNIILPYGDAKRPSGSPYAIGLWQEEGMIEPRLFMTYARDTRADPVQPDFINPNKLLVYSFSTIDPKNVLLRNSDIKVGDYAEVGLVYNPATQHMLGTYAGFPYVDAYGDEAVCNSEARGGTYAINFDGGVLAGDAPGVWKLPHTVVGNPPLVSDSLQWKNPFEIAINPNNGKVYVTDRCWNEFPDGGQSGGGAVLIFADEGTGEPSTPTPTPTTNPTTSPTTNPTTSPTTSPTAEPTPSPVILAFDGPSSANPGESFTVAVEAQGVGGDGIYGAQLDVNYDSSKVTVSNSQVNANLPFVVLNNVDNVAGKITMVASRQGDVSGLTGDVVLLTFEVTVATDASGEVTFTFENEKLGNPEATAFDVIPQSYTVTIGPEPTTSPTPTTEPTTEPTTSPTPTTEPTTEPTISPTPTTEPTTEPTTSPTPTTEPTSEPTTSPTPTTEPGMATLTGQVSLSGRANNNWSDAVVSVDDSGQSYTTGATGQFSIVDVTPGLHTSITADAPGYLPSVCTAPTITAPETILVTVALKSGDVNGDNIVDITDATAVGLSLGNTGPGLPTDINRDEIVDVLDIILVSINFGEGVQTWNCLSD